jgi:hypothetical protein
MGMSRPAQGLLYLYLLRIVVAGMHLVVFLGNFQFSLKLVGLLYREDRCKAMFWPQI